MNTAEYARQQVEAEMIDFKSLSFGVELECTNQTRERVAQAIQSVVGGTIEHVGSPSSLDPWHVTDKRNRIWKVVADSSLSDAPPNLRAEVVTPVLAYPDIAEFQDVIRSVRRCGSRASETCGCHIHVSSEHFTGRTIANLVKTFFKYQNLIIPALGVRPDRLARYAKPIDPNLIRRIEQRPPRTLDDMNTLWFGTYTPHPDHYHPSRYCALNLASLFQKSTVEVRAANSSLHAGKIRAYIVFVLALVAKALNSRWASSRPREYDPTTARYDFRVFAVIGLGLIGPEYRSCRQHLLENLAGDSAYKRGRSESRVKSTRDGQELVEVGYDTH
ncbi:MAG: amidoligase family protein [Armatimonadota bacterium]